MFKYGMENKPLIIGLTGGIGAGKSTVRRYFERIHQIPSYDADTRAKWLINHLEPLKTQLIELFGQEAYTHGTWTPSVVSPKIMANPELTKQLNGLVHPCVKTDFAQWHAQQNAPYVIKEAALLIEAGTYQECDRLAVVTAMESTRIQRILNRDPQRSISEIKNILARQLPESEKLKLANDIIYNEEQQALIPQLEKLHRIWLSLSLPH